jgi:hypothetical protein
LVQLLLGKLCLSDLFVSGIELAGSLLSVLTHFELDFPRLILRSEHFHEVLSLEDVNSARLRRTDQRSLVRSLGKHIVIPESKTGPYNCQFNLPVDLLRKVPLYLLT